jgi:HEAT repeat protein
MATVKKDSGNPNMDIIAFLRQDELDYPGGAAKFGKAALPFLSELINSNDESMATKAAYLAGYIKNTTVKDILHKAASSNFPTVRIAAAYGAQRLDAKSGQAVLNKALDDTDPGVIKHAMKSAVTLNVARNLKAKISKISKDFHDEHVKSVANSLMRKM